LLAWKPIYIAKSLCLKIDILVTSRFPAYATYITGLPFSVYQMIKWVPDTFEMFGFRFGWLFSYNHGCFLDGYLTKYSATWVIHMESTNYNGPTNGTMVKKREKTKNMLEIIYTHHISVNYSFW